jgi:hypothetical protein
MTFKCNSRKLYILSGIPWELTWHASDFSKLYTTITVVYLHRTLEELEFVFLSSGCKRCRRRKLLLSEVYVQHRNQKGEYHNQFEPKPPQCLFLYVEGFG